MINETPSVSVSVQRKDEETHMLRSIIWMNELPNCGRDVERSKAVRYLNATGVLLASLWLVWKLGMQHMGDICVHLSLVCRTRRANKIQAAHKFSTPAIFHVAACSGKQRSKW